MLGNLLKFQDSKWWFTVTLKIKSVATGGNCAAHVGRRTGDQKAGALQQSKFHQFVLVGFVCGNLA